MYPFNYKEMNDRIERYFANISDEDLKRDMEECGYSFYSRIQIPVAYAYNQMESEFIVVSHKTTVSPTIKGALINCRNTITVDNDSIFGFDFAA